MSCFLWLTSSPSDAQQSACNGIWYKGENDDEATHHRFEAGNIPTQPAWKSLKVGDVRPISQILPRIYLGSLHAAADQAELKRLGITHVLNMAGSCAYSPYNVLFGQTIMVLKDEASFKYKDKTVPDNVGANLTKMFAETTTFIRNALASEGSILIHCMMGVSRSTSVLIAYLIDTEGFTYDDAFALIKSKRMAAEPNPGFIKQLRSHEKRNRAKKGMGRQTMTTGQPLPNDALAFLADKKNYV